MLKPQYRGAVQPVRGECHGINSCYRTLAPAKIGINLKEKQLQAILQLAFDIFRGKHPTITHCLLYRRILF